MADQYEAFSDETFALAPPTNGRVKRLMELELRSTMGGPLHVKKETARMMGWDPADKIPGHSREETVEQGGEEKEVTRDNNLDPLPLPDYTAKAAEVVLLGCETEGREDELRIGEVREAINDFTERGLGMSADSAT